MIYQVGPSILIIFTHTHTHTLSLSLSLYLSPSLSLCALSVHRLQIVITRTTGAPTVPHLPGHHYGHGGALLQT